MSDELFEVAFSGQIRDGAVLAEVKARVAKMFKADDAKIAQMFSGKRIVIKRKLDKEAASKYANAFKKAGARCEVKSMSGDASSTKTESKAKEAKPQPAILEVDFTTTQEINVPTRPPPKVDPLGITGQQIDDLPATLAPVGSAMQDEIKEVPEPDIDITAFNVAPVGSDIGTKKKEAAPPQPDTTGLEVIEP